MFYVLLILAGVINFATIVNEISRSGIQNTLLIYLIMFSVFFIFRSSILYSGLDDFFPDAIYFGHIGYDSYITGAAGFLIFSCTISFMSFMFTKKNSAINIILVNYNSCKYAVLTIFIISTLYFIYCYSVAGSFERIVFVARIDKEVGFGFLRPAVSTGVMLSAMLVIIRKTPLSISVYLAFIFYNIGMGDRSGVIYSFLLISAYMVVTYDGRLNYKKIPIVTVSIGLVFFLSVVIKNLRTESIGGQVAEGVVRSISSGLNLNVIDAYYLSISYLGNIYDYRLGYDVFLGVIGVIPRFFWAGKPEVIDTGTWFAQLFSNYKMGTPISALGEWYINFSYIGLLFCAALTFSICKFFDRFLNFGTLDLAIKLSFAFLVVQTGFSNTTLRDMVMFTLYVLLPVYLSWRLGSNRENTIS